MSASVLITGSNRGIGKELLRLYLARSHTTAIAAVRNVNDPSVKELHALPVAGGSKLIVVNLDVASPTGASQAVEELKSKYKITKIDTVIANAGIGKQWGPAAKAPIQDIDEHFQINAIGPVRLFQAVEDLLFASSTPRFVVLGTVLASITLLKDYPIPDATYGMSKIAASFFVAKLHHENPQLITFPIHPGWVSTDMGNSVATSIGMTEAPVKVEDSGAGIFKQIENSTREKTSGKFMSFDGSELPW